MFRSPANAVNAFWVLVVVFVFVVSTAPTTPAAAQGGQQWNGNAANINQSAFFVARNGGQWQEMWSKTGRKPPRRFVGRDRMAVGIFIGRRRTGGFNVEITDIRADKDFLVVSYTVRPPRGPATQVITSPWRIMAMRETDRPIVFRRVKAGQDFYIFPPTEFARLDRRMDNDNGHGRAYRQCRRENRVLQDRAEHAAQRYQSCESAYNDLVDRLRRVTPQGGYDYQGPPPQGGWQNPNR